MALSDWYADYGIDVVVDAVTSPLERVRKHEAQVRVDLLNDDYIRHVEEQINRTFKAQEVRDALLPFLPLACVNSLQKRISTEIARPIYSIPPRRSVTPAAAEDAYRKIADAVDLDAVMNLVCEMLVNCNDFFLLVRWIDAAVQPDGTKRKGAKPLGWSIDVISAGLMTIIPHPRKPSVALAYAYERTDHTAFGKQTRIVVWDDEVTYTIDADGRHFVEGPVEHGLDRVPIVEVHESLRMGEPFNRRRGFDLVAACIADAFVTALQLKLHYQQGEKLIAAISDDPPHDQTMDGGAILQFPVGSQVISIDNVTDPAHYLKTKADIETTIAANYGISRARLNQQKDGADGDDTALYERTAQIMRVARNVEQDLFDVFRLLSPEAPEDERIADGAELTIDYGEFSERTDRLAQLEILGIEVSMGTGNVLQDIMRRNPEVRNYEEAKAHLRENVAIRAEVIQIMRELDAPADPTKPVGLSPQGKGALGPQVRDGKMTRDEAAQQAAGADAADVTATEQTGVSTVESALLSKSSRAFIAAETQSEQ